MKPMLLSIQDTVIQYAKIISKVVKIDIEVVDSNLYRIACTGLYADEINKDMSSNGYVYKHVLKTGKRMIITNPGEDGLCKNCPDRNNCKESFEISTPISIENEIIGVIGLVCGDESQKQILEENLNVYLEFLDQMADFIAIKAFDEARGNKLAATIKVLDNVIDDMEQGVFMLSQNNIITKINESAKKQLGLEREYTGEALIINDTGDTLNGLNEYKIRFDKKEYTVMGGLNRLEEGSEQFSQILIFKESKGIKNQLYNMTTTINNLSTKNIIGSSIKTMQLKENINKVAKSSSTILITGESGTGKEMVATAIWKAGSRSDNKFVAINCGAIPEALLESELFGYVKGAFTGADPNGRIGKFELANNGVIFLDEIGDMPLYLQVKLLRVLQERTIVRIGSNQIISLNVRVIAATNKDLKEMIEENKFREDLYYRLNVIPLQIAPLRERIEDIPVLVEFFINRYAKLFNKYYSHIEEATMGLLMTHNWPGNVRELENTVEFMINMMNENGILDNKTLSKEILKSHENRQIKNILENNNSVVRLQDLERHEIIKALNVYGRDTEGKRRAANVLGIGLATLYRKIESYNIQ